MKNWVRFLLAATLLERLWRAIEVFFFFRRTPPPAINNPQIDVAQPILSGDPALRNCLAHNLATACAPNVRFLWMVDSTDRQALEVCEDLQRSHPHHSIRITLTPPAPAGANPKTYKLEQALGISRAEYFAVLDDDTMLPAGGLETAISYLRRGRLAFGLPYYISFDGFWSSMAAAFVNANSLWAYIPYLRFCPPITINGMFYATRRADLEEIDAFAQARRFVCDDYHVARLFRARGWRLIQTPVRHAIRTSIPDLGSYSRLLKRWMVFPAVSIQRWERGRSSIVFRLLGLGGAILPLLAAFSWRAGGWTYLAAHIASCLWADRRFLKRATPAKAWPLLFFQALLLPFQFAWASLFWRRIVWRGKRMELQRDGSLETRP